MAGRRYTGSGRYRGRRGESSALRTLVIVLAVLLAALVLVYLFLGRYIQYTDDGVHLILPWAEEDGTVTQSAPVYSEFVVEENEPGPSALPEQGPVDERKPLIRLEAVEVTADEVISGAADGIVKTSGGNTLVVEVKNDEGYLAWDSEAMLAVDAQLGGTAEFREAIAALDEADELYLVARMSVFQDLWMCVHDKSLALTVESGKLWYDTYGMPWLSAANDRVVQYIFQLCIELAQMGFDEILLENAAFPDRGRLSAVVGDGNYPEDREGYASRFLSSLSGLLKGIGVRVSVRVRESDLGGENEKSGWTAAGLACADRIWLVSDGDADSAARALTEAGMKEAGERLVRIWPEVPEDRSTSWAVLTEE